MRCTYSREDYIQNPSFNDGITLTGFIETISLGLRVKNREYTAMQGLICLNKQGVFGVYMGLIG
jgi:hypothetical protein